MKRYAWAAIALAALVIVAFRMLGPTRHAVVRADDANAYAAGSNDGIPTFQVDPFWPKELPNAWALGTIGGVASDPSNDHIWITNRTNSLADDERYLTATPPPSRSCCRPAPSVIEFDGEGNVVRSWSPPGGGEHGIDVDHKGNVWVVAGGDVLKFTKDGKLLLRIGKEGQTARDSNDVEDLKVPSKLQVWAKTNELFVADGYENRRIIVFDADTGRYKRHWGAFGNTPDDAAPRPRLNRANHSSPFTALDGARGPEQFNLVHGVQISDDGYVYVADRLNNRVQAFKVDGTFVREAFIERRTLAQGSAYDVEFSADPQQRFLYVADGTNNHLWILSRDTFEILGRIGREGQYAEQFYHVHAIASDSQGHIYAGETQGHRVQKFRFMGLSGRKP